MKIRNFVDLLALVSHETTEKEDIDAFIYGLPEEYEMFVTSINLRTDSYSVVELESLILNHEAMLERKHNESETLGLSGMENLATTNQRS